MAVGNETRMRGETRGEEDGRRWDKKKSRRRMETRRDEWRRGQGAALSGYLDVSAVLPKSAARECWRGAGEVLRGCAGLAGAPLPSPFSPRQKKYLPGGGILA